MGRTMQRNDCFLLITGLSFLCHLAMEGLCFERLQKECLRELLVIILPVVYKHTRGCLIFRCTSTLAVSICLCLLSLALWLPLTQIRNFFSPLWTAHVLVPVRVYNHHLTPLARFVNSPAPLPFLQIFSDLR